MLADSKVTPNFNVTGAYAIGLNNGEEKRRVGLGVISVLRVKTVYLSSGVFFISLALCADAAIGNVQEKAMKRHHASNSEMVFPSVFFFFFF